MSNIDSAALAERLFHAYDIRIDAGLLDYDHARRLFDAIAVYARTILKVDSVLLCRDARLSGNSLLQQGIEHFSCLGFSVHTELNPVSTCQFYFSCSRLGSILGIMIGASHNPGRYTGQKLVGPYCIPIAQDIGPAGGLTQIRQLFIQGAALDLASKRGDILCIEDRTAYVQACLSWAGVEKGSLHGLRVVLDFLSGTAAAEVLLGLQEAGVHFVARNVVPDGNFPSGPPNPILEQSIKPTVAYLKEHPYYDFCFCFDGDGDRVDTIAHGLVNVEPSLVLAFLAPGFKRFHPDSASTAFGFDPKANPLLVNSIKAYGAKPQLIPNGHSKIKELLVKRNAQGMVAAVEESAHYYITLAYEGRIVATESTLLIILLFLKTWREEKQRFLDLLDLQNSVERKREWGYTYANDSNRAKALSRVEKAFLSQGFESVNTQADGTLLGSSLLRIGAAGESPVWACISQRSSESEEGVARWSVVASDAGLLAQCVDTIDTIAAQDAIGSYQG
ncbi:MAG: hypothetical protein PHI41_10815 [Erysipelotrichaceae bacterium]|nr:hypothetical protein [Erysipelotrichaceae bacterium]